MGREADVAIHTFGLAVECKVLKPGVGPIGDDELGIAAGAVIEPEAVRRLELARGRRRFRRRSAPTWRPCRTGGCKFEP